MKPPRTFVGWCVVRATGTLVPQSLAPTRAMAQYLRLAPAPGDRIIRVEVRPHLPRRKLGR